MRIYLALLALLSVTLGPAFPAEPEKPSAKASLESVEPAERLDALFASLRRERAEKAAERIAGRIWNEWFHSGSASIDLMMLWAKEAIDAKKFDVALDFLDQVVLLKPDYAEGWNRRATVHFMMQSYGKSMADIEHTLRLEPRHFGALAGMAQILKDTGRKERALAAYERVLAIYPMMRNAQNAVSTLSEKLAGEGI